MSASTAKPNALRLVSDNPNPQREPHPNATVRVTVGGWRFIMGEVKKHAERIRIIVKAVQAYKRDIQRLEKENKEIKEELAFLRGAIETITDHLVKNQNRR